MFDAHFHIIDPRFPLVENQGFLPDPFTVADYRNRTAGLDVTGGAVVGGSFQAFDQTYLLDALGQLGGDFVGVTQLPGGVSDAEINRLDQGGVRALRFNLYRGGSNVLSDSEHLARRVHDLVGWHSEFYLDSHDLPDLEPMLTRLPRVSIDHLGMSDEHFDVLLGLVSEGVAVKATGFGRINHADPDATMRRIVETNPTALIFGTDLPSTRAKVPFLDTDVDRVVRAVGSIHAEAVLKTNAARLYRLIQEPT